MHRLATSLLATGLVILAQTASSTPAAANDSYRKTCWNIVQNGNILSASCRGTEGFSYHSSVDVNLCARLGEDVANINGRLHCVGHVGGTYQQSCSVTAGHWIVLEGILYASCKSRSGAWIDSQIQVSSCAGGNIANIDGHLACTSR